MQFHDWPCRGRVSTEKMAPVRRLLGRQLRQRNSGSCPGSIRPGITYFSLFPYAFCASPAADPPLQPKVSVFQKVSLCAGPLRSVSEFSGFLYLTRMATSPTDFYNHILFEFLPPGLGEALRRARAPRLFRGASADALSPSGAQLPCVRIRPACFIPSPPLTVWMWVLLYIFRYMYYNQLDFRWFSMLIVF